MLAMIVIMSVMTQNLNTALRFPVLPMYSLPGFRFRRI